MLVEVNLVLCYGKGLVGKLLVACDSTKTSEEVGNLVADLYAVGRSIFRHLLYHEVNHLCGPSIALCNVLLGLLTLFRGHFYGILQVIGFGCNTLVV